MPVEKDTATYDSIGQTIENGTLIVHDEERSASLISDTTLPADTVRLEEIDSEPGRFRTWTEHPSPDEPDEPDVFITDMTFDKLRDARLAFGLWQRCGPFNQPESGRAIPIEVAADGKEALAAYLRLGNGYLRTRESVASELDLSVQTVSNYCNRVRWTPD